MRHYRVRMSAMVAVVLGALLALGPSQITAQTGTATGQVLDAATGAPLNGVQVSMPSVELGTLTNAQGRYLINLVPAGDHTVRVELIGYGTLVATVNVTAGGTATLNFRLDEEAVALEGLLVTALGITRQQRALGFAVQSIEGERLLEARETNLVNSLAGQIAGVQVTNTGPIGGSSRIVLRGANSIAGENQPLFVVDGIPVDNSSDGYLRGGVRRRGNDPTTPQPKGSDYGNTVQDLNASDIESVSILKGANAAALYGSRAANGAVVITTKRGASAGAGTNVAISVSTNFTMRTPLKMPTYQNQYGQGSSGLFGFIDGFGGGQNDGTDESWGPRMDGRLQAAWYSDGLAVPFTPKPFNVRDYFKSASTWDTNIGVAATTERANARLSVTRTDQNGMVPGHANDRTSIFLSASADVTDKLSVSGASTYTARRGQHIPEVGYEGFNPLQGYLWFGRQVSTHRLEQFGQVPDQDTPTQNWNYNYHDNPYWESEFRDNRLNRDRANGHLQTNYRINDWLSVMLRAGTDWYQEARKETRPPGARDIDGGFDDIKLFRQEINTDFLVAAQRNLTSDLNVSFRVGGNHRTNDENIDVVTANNLNVPGIYNVSNVSQPPVIRNWREKKQVNSLYGFATFSWRDYLFLDVTGRNDWSSTLPTDDNSYFYPSVSSSLVFTDVTDAFSGLLSYGKLRASWAKVGNDAAPYQLASVLSAANPFGTRSGFSVNNAIPNSGLRPESTVSWEVGTDLRSADDRVALDLTYYRTTTTDQILGVQVSSSSGFTSQVLNAGKIENKGVEVVLSATPVRGALQWDVTANFSKNNSEVVELTGDLESIILGEFWRTTVEARPGEAYGALVGFKIKRDSQGQVVVSSQGLLQGESSKSVMGHYTPDWLAGIRNSVSYRDLTLSFLVDWRQGGEVFTVTNQWGQYSGVNIESAIGREEGAIVDYRGDLVRAVPERTCALSEPCVLIDGVKEDGSPNDIWITAERFAHTQWNKQEGNVYDATFIKLREVTLSFDFPTGLLSRLPFERARMSIVGRNLILLKSNVPHIDPESGFDNTNFQGIEYGQLPSGRTFGFNLSITP